MNKIFNSFVFAALVLTVIFWVIPMIDYHWRTEQELSFLGSSGWNSILPISPFFYWVSLSVWVVVSIGLLKRVKYFRSIYFVVIVSTAISSFLWGYIVRSPLEYGIESIVMLLDGSILTMAYFTSVSKSFERNPNKAISADAKSRAAE